MNKLLHLACVALAAGAAHAQSTPPDMPDVPQSEQQDEHVRPAAAPDPHLPTVNIQGTRANDMEERRLSTAAKMIIGREELDRNGDSSVGEILKRLPGVTVGGRPGRGGDVRMRGMAGGYTQLLVNGERPPGGFSMESLAPDQVERIEIIRGTVAEHSARAIAGTINIVLREGYQQKDIQFKLADTVEQGKHRPNVAVAYPGKTGKLTWLLSGTVSGSDQQDASFTHNRDITAAGLVSKDQLLHDSSERHGQSLHLTPRLSYRFDDGDTLTFQPFLMSNRGSGSNHGTLDQDAGLVPPDYVLVDGTSTSSSTFLRGFGNYVHRGAGGARLDIKFGGGTGHSDSEARRHQVDSAGQPQDFFDSNATRDRSATLGAKYSERFGKGHQFTAGADAEAGKRDQVRISLDNNDNPEFGESGANLTASTRRMAAFAQDEWDLTPQIAVYAGLRWEGIRTRSTSAGKDVANDSSVWSPMLHGVWRIPSYPKDQVRASLTHAYKAPSPNDLIAAPSFSRLNSATRPDSVGNPNLKPELSHGMDLAYEHYLGKSGILTANTFVRDIKDLIRRQTTLAGTRWVSAPANIGHAVTTGVELEAKVQLAELNPGGPNIDLRSNYSRFWSHVDDIPGPNNRLAQQPKQTANIGVDYRFRELPLTLGGSYNWTPATLIQNSATEVLATSVKHQFDAYGLWKFSPHAQLRVSANNLLGRDYESGRAVSEPLLQTADALAHTYTSVSVKLELKL